jgi:hypothetical protein
VWHACAQNKVKALMQTANKSGFRYRSEYIQTPAVLECIFLALPGNGLYKIHDCDGEGTTS